MVARCWDHCAGYWYEFVKHSNITQVTYYILQAILAAAPSHQSGHFVFSTFIDGTGVDGVGWSERASPAYVAVIGILMAQYTLTGKEGRES